MQLEAEAGEQLQHTAPHTMPLHNNCLWEHWASSLNLRLQLSVSSQLQAAAARSQADCDHHVPVGHFGAAEPAAAT